MPDSGLPTQGLRKEKESYTFSPSSSPTSKTKNNHLHSSGTNTGYKKYESNGKKYISTAAPRRKLNNFRTFNDATEWTSTGTGEVVLTGNGRSEQNLRGRSIKSSKFVPSAEINGLDELTDQVYEDKITGNEVYTDNGPVTVTSQVTTVIYNCLKNH